jgi:hypothetical protein
MRRHGIPGRSPPALYLVEDGHDPGFVFDCPHRRFHAGENARIGLEPHSLIASNIGVAADATTRFMI